MIGIIIGASHSSDSYILFGDNVALIYEKIICSVDLILDSKAACHLFYKVFLYLIVNFKMKMKIRGLKMKMQTISNSFSLMEILSILDHSKLELFSQVIS